MDKSNIEIDTIYTGKKTKSPPIIKELDFFLLLKSF